MSIYIYMHTHIPTYGHIHIRTDILAYCIPLGRVYRIKFEGRNASSGCRYPTGSCNKLQPACSASGTAPNGDSHKLEREVSLQYSETVCTNGVTERDNRTDRACITRPRSAIADDRSAWAVATSEGNIPDTNNLRMYRWKTKRSVHPWEKSHYERL